MIFRSRAASTGKPLIDLDNVESKGGRGQPFGFQEQKLTQMEAQSDLQQVEERERQLRQLEQDILSENIIYTENVLF